MPQQPNDWKTVEPDDWKTVEPNDWKTVSPKLGSPTKDKGLLQKWDEAWVNQPLSRHITWNGEKIIDPQRASAHFDPIEERREDQWKIPEIVPYIGGGTWRSLGAGMLEGASNVTEGLSTPLNLATAGVSLGAGTAARSAQRALDLGKYVRAAGGMKIAQDLTRAERALSAPVIGSGAARIERGLAGGEDREGPVDWGDVAFGGAEMAGGAAGTFQPKPGLTLRPELHGLDKIAAQQQQPPPPDAPPVDTPPPPPPAGEGIKVDITGPQVVPGEEFIVTRATTDIPPDVNVATIKSPDHVVIETLKRHGFIPSKQTSPSGFIQWVRRGPAGPVGPVKPPPAAAEKGLTAFDPDEGVSVPRDKLTPERIEQLKADGYEVAPNPDGVTATIRRFFTEEKGEFDPEKLFRRPKWLQRPTRKPLHGDEQIPDLSFQPDEGVASAREFSEHFLPEGEMNETITNPITREEINRETEMAPEGVMNEITASHPAVIDEARSIYFENDPQKISENLARYSAEEKEIHTRWNQAQSDRLKNNIPVPPELQAAYNRIFRLKHLAQAKYERASTRQLEGRFESVEDLLKRFVGEEEGTFDPEEMWRNLKRLMGREPTSEEVDRGMARQPRPGEQTGRVAEFGLPSQEPPTPKFKPGQLVRQKSTGQIGRIAVSPEQLEAMTLDQLNEYRQTVTSRAHPTDKAGDARTLQEIDAEIAIKTEFEPYPPSGVPETPVNPDELQGFLDTAPWKNPYKGEEGPFLSTELPPKQNVMDPRNIVTSPDMNSRILQEIGQETDIPGAERTLNYWIDRDNEPLASAAADRAGQLFQAEARAGNRRPPYDVVDMLDGTFGVRHVESSEIVDRTSSRESAENITRQMTISEAIPDVDRPRQISSELPFGPARLHEQSQLERIGEPYPPASEFAYEPEGPEQGSMRGEMQDAEISAYLRGEDATPPEMRDLETGEAPKRVWSEELKRFITEEEGSSQWEGWVIEYLKKKFRRLTGLEPSDRELENFRKGVGRIPGEGEPVPVLPDANEVLGMDRETSAAFIEPAKQAIDYWERIRYGFADKGDSDGAVIAFENKSEAERILSRLEGRDSQGEIPGAPPSDILDAMKRLNDLTDRLEANRPKVPDEDLSIYGDSAREQAEGAAFEAESPQPNIEVKQQPNSKTWGLYVDGELREGFFERAAAERAAENYRREIDPSYKTPQDLEWEETIKGMDDAELKRRWEQLMEREDYENPDIGPAMRAIDAELARRSEQPEVSSLVKSDPMTKKYVDIIQHMDAMPTFELNHKVVEAKSLITKSMERKLTPTETKRFNQLAKEIQGDPKLPSLWKRFLSEESGEFTPGEMWEEIKKTAGWGKGSAGRTMIKETALKVENFIDEATGLSKAATTIGDFSAVLRHALPTVLEPEFYKALGPMFKGAFSEKIFNQIDKNLRQKKLFRPQFDPATMSVRPSIAEELGYPLLELGKKLNKRGEAVASNWIENGGLFGPKTLFGKTNPVRAGYAATLGQVARGSNRAFTTLLNHIGANLFERLMNTGKDLSMTAAATGEARPGFMKQKFTPEEAIELDPYRNQMLGKDIADFVKTALGRAPLYTHIVPHAAVPQLNLEGAARLLTKVLFAPRLFARTVRMLNPNTYVMARPMVRKQYLKALLAMGVGWGALTSATKLAGDAMGLDVELGTDPDSSDFGKLVISGRTRLDFGAGFLPYFVAMHRFLSGEYTSSSTQETHRYGEGFQAETQGEAHERFIANKLDPLVKFVYDLEHASEYQPFHVADRTAQLFIGLVYQDFIDLMYNNPEAAPLVIPPVIFGAGTQTYEKGESQGKLIDPENDWIIKHGPSEMFPWNWGDNPPPGFR